MGNVIMSIDKKSADFIPTIRKIVSRMEGIHEDLMLSKTRKREIVCARQIAMYFAKNYTKASLAVIGQEIGGKDHATVLHATKTVNNLSETDRYYRGRLVAMRERIEEVAISFENNDNDFVCTECGNKSIKTKAWINPNTNGVLDLINVKYPANNWCNECVAYVVLISYKEFIEKEGMVEVLDEIPENPNPSKIIIDNRSDERKLYDKTVKEISKEF